MSGARQELLDTGALGPIGIELLYKTVRQVVRNRNLPPPPGMPAWTSEELTEAAHDVFAERGPQRLLNLAARSTDEASFRAQLWRTVVNDLISRGRRTERGRLTERVKDVLPHVPGITQQAGRVRLTDATGAGFPRFDDLVQAAAGVQVNVPAWDPTSDRNPPIADRDSLVAMIKAVLSVAPSGLSMTELVSALAVRLRVYDMPDQMEISLLDQVAPPAMEDPAGLAEDREAGARLLAHLTPHEQMVLPYLDESATVVARQTGLGRTKAWQTANSTRLKLAELMQDDQEAAGALREAASMARAAWRLP